MSDTSKQKKQKRWRRLGLFVALGGAMSLLGLWIAVNRFDWLGPVVADSLRAVVGKRNVARLEDFTYGIQDRLFRFVRRGEKPKSYWQVPAESEAQSSLPISDPSDPSKPALPPFKPKTVGPVHESWAAPGDGQWVPMPDADHPERPVRMFKTLLHPDKQRSWAELFVVAIDLRRVVIQLVPGTKEPAATEDAAQSFDRPGRVPPEQEADVLAAFNGGFKTEHGHYGMKLGDLLVVKPKEGVCTVARYKDNSMRIAAWSRLKDTEADMLWWRQTPYCMYENNVVHPGLKEGSSKKWGATLDGDTVIRRSAIGISEDGKELFVGISNHTTAPAIALGMNHAGAVTVAQLDINYSYPKFVTFQKNAEQSKRIAIALADGFEFSEDEFIRKPARRDFFYVMPAGDDGRTASNFAASPAPAKP